MGQYCLLYDSHCLVCQFFKGVVERLDTKGIVTSIPFSEGHLRAGHPLELMDPDLALRSFHIVGPKGELRSGGEAILMLMGLLPIGGPFLKVIGRFPFLKMVVGKAYTVFAHLTHKHKWKAT